MNNSTSTVLMIPENSRGHVIGRLTAVDEDRHSRHKFFVHDFAQHLTISGRKLKVSGFSLVFYSYRLSCAQQVFRT